MVSAQKYIQTFCKVMPKRYELFFELLRRKRIIDKAFGPLRVQEILQILGESRFLSSAERRKEPTLRHLVFKQLKSFEFYVAFEKKERPNSRLITSARFSLDDALNQISTYVQSYSSYFETLEEIYSEQVKLLKKEKYEQYLSLCLAEEEVMEGIAKPNLKIRSFFEAWV